jgi:hypothetical protein
VRSNKSSSFFYHGIGEIDVGSDGAVMERLERPNVVAQCAFGRFTVPLYQTTKGVQLFFLVGRFVLNYDSFHFFVLKRAK